MKINTATKITILRIILIPLIIGILVLNENNDSIVKIFNFKIHYIYFVTFIIYLIASLSDAVDGYIARSTNSITNLGKFLDPIADKLLVNSLLIYFCSTNHLSVVIVIIMIARDIMVDALRLICIENNIVIAASSWGKFKTIFQMVSIGLLLLVAFPNTPLNNYVSILFYITTIISVYSGFDYFKKNITNLKD